MLQIYDKVKSTSLLAFAAIGGLAFSPVASAIPNCDMSDGYSARLADYVAEATACLSETETINTSLEGELGSQMNTAREALGLSALDRRASLDKAARTHALDMATRGYASHSDMEGRNHLYRIGAFDRSMLVGATGANVLTVSADQTASAVFAVMGQDVQNAQNITFEGFTDYGAGAVTIDGKTHLVMVFAAREGELDEALPLTLAKSAPLTADIKRLGSEMVGWSLSDHASGAVVARGSAPNLRPIRLETVDTASLDIVVNVREDEHVLRGPIVSSR